MRIGFDAKRLYNNFTGLGNYSRFVVDALEKFYPNNQYFLFTPKVKRTEDTLPFVESSCLTTVLPSQWVSKAKLGSVWRSMLVGQHAKTMKVDLYHGLSQELPFLMPKNILSVVTIHDLIFLRFPEFYNPIDVQIYKAKVKHACKTADAIIAISEQTAKDLVEYIGADEAKIKVIYQGCHPNFKRQFSSKQLAAIKLKYKLPDRFLLNVGTIEPRKNALIIVKALRSLKHKIPLVIIGRPTPYLDIIKVYANQFNLQNQILYLHQVDFKDLPAIYRLASVFIYPSLFEGFGIPLVEAITCDVPVITSNGSCFSEAAGPSAIYFDSRSETELAVQIERVLGNESLQATMKADAKTYIRKFEPDFIAKDLVGVYDNLTNRL